MFQAEFYCANQTQVNKADECEFLLENSLDCFTKLLENKTKNVLVTGNASCGKTTLVLEYIKRNKHKYKNIVYASFDKEKYLFYDKSSRVSIDCILKKSLVKPIIKKCKTEVNDYISELEKLLCKDSLVVVDDYEIHSLSPYMRRLAKLASKLVVISRSGMNTLPSGFEMLIPKSDNGVFCEDFTLDAIVKGLSQKTNFDVTKFVYNNADEALLGLFDCCLFNEEEKELLMTLCAMLCYLDDATHVLSSKCGVFDKESVEFYLKSLSQNLDKLTQFGFVKQLCNGQLCIDKRIIDFVMSKLNPTAENCKSFMRFVQSETNFLISQSSKDELARFCVPDSGEFGFAVNEEFSDVYTHFYKTDSDRVRRLYLILMSRSLLFVAEEDEYTGHLLMNNKNCYIRCLAEEMNEDLCKIIYSDELYDDTSQCRYSNMARKHLDILRICVMFLRNITHDLYAENLEIIDVFLKSLNALLYECQSLNDSDELKLELVDDCIRICYETFAYHEIVSKTGQYNGFRESGRERLRYGGAFYSDSMYANSLDMGYSVKTISLYAVFQQFLDEWLCLCEALKPDFYNSFLEQYHNEKLVVIKKCRESISVNYCRIKRGLNNFDDFCSQENTKVKILSEKSAEQLDKVLYNNRHLLKCGFDSGTKAGAYRYAEKVMAAIKNCKNNDYLVCLLLSSDYPVSPVFYKYLSEMNFERTVLQNRDMVNRSKLKLALHLINVYNAVMPEPKRKVIEELTEGLCENQKFSVAFEERFYHVVSSMYLESKTHEYASCFNGDCSFANKMYVKYCLENEKFTDMAEDFIAKAIYGYENKNIFPKDKKRLQSAFENIRFTYLTKKNDFNEEGLLNLSSLLL